MFRAFNLKVWGLVVTATLLGGCVQIQTAPRHVKTGDHVLIGIGGIARNGTSDVSLTRSDLSISITDANGMTYDLEARYLFKSYPDPASQLNVLSITGSGIAGTIPFDGSWFAVAPLTVPGDYDNPLPLAVGPASISVTSPKLVNTRAAGEGNLNNIPLRIIPGTMPPDPFSTLHYWAFEPSPNAFVILPSGLSGSETIGGAQLVMEYNDDSFFAGGRLPVVVPADLNPHVQLSYEVIPNGDGSGSVRILLLNPNGFTDSASAALNAAPLAQLAVKAIYFNSGSGSQSALAKANFSLDPAQSYYVDMDGAQLGGITPTLTHVEDL